LTPDRVGSQVITGVLIQNNLFFGLTGEAPEDTIKPARAAIRTGRRAHLCSVMGNFFRRHQYEVAIVDDEPDTADTTPANAGKLGPPGINSFIGNAVQFGKDDHQGEPNAPRVLPTISDIFSAGGAGWAVFPHQAHT
jgi:hypothetical protein